MTSSFFIFWGYIYTVYIYIYIYITICQHYEDRRFQNVHKQSQPSLWMTPYLQLQSFPADPAQASPCEASTTLPPPGMAAGEASDMDVVHQSLAALAPPGDRF